MRVVRLYSSTLSWWIFALKMKWRIELYRNWIVCLLKKRRIQSFRQRSILHFHANKRHAFHNLSEFTIEIPNFKFDIGWWFQPNKPANEQINFPIKRSKNWYMWKALFIHSISGRWFYNRNSFSSFLLIFIVIQIQFDMGIVLIGEHYQSECRGKEEEQKMGKGRINWRSLQIYCHTEYRAK